MSDTRECGFLGCGDDLCADLCTGLGGQMRVVPDHPVPDDKVGVPSSLDYFLIPENVKDVSPVKYEKVGDGMMFKAPPALVKPEPHKCKPPKFEHNEPFQWRHQWIESNHKIPDGSFWVCDTCGSRFMARSSELMGGDYKRRWAKMHWYSFIVKATWNRLHKMEG